MSQSAFIDPLVGLLAYESYTYEKPADPVAACIKQLVGFIERNSLGSRRIGIEPTSFPFTVTERLKELYPNLEWVNISKDIAQFRLIKEEDEIAFIRQAAALADIGQEAVLRYARPGMRELELFAMAHRDVEVAVGHRVPLMSDLSSGAGTNSGGGMPGNKFIETGDLILSDFQPCLEGYWGDSCNTHCIGTPDSDQKRTFALVKEALEIGIGAIRPSVRAKTVDRLMREHIGDYPHHSGHSVGTAYHEDPRITPYNDMELAPGMVIALEPAIYKGGYGIRLEHLVLVTSAGCEILTQFQHRFEQ